VDLPQLAREDAFSQSLRPCQSVILASLIADAHRRLFQHSWDNLQFLQSFDQEIHPVLLLLVSNDPHLDAVHNVGHGWA